MMVGYSIIAVPHDSGQKIEDAEIGDDPILKNTVCENSKY